MSAQSRSSLMHAISSATVASPRQASAQAEQVAAQSLQASTHSMMAGLTVPRLWGWLRIMSPICISLLRRDHSIFRERLDAANVPHEAPSEARGARDRAG